MEGRDHPAPWQGGSSLLRSGALGDGQGEGALLVEAERVHAVDHKLSRKHVLKLRKQFTVALPRNGDDNDVAAAGRSQVVIAADETSCSLGQLGGGRLCSRGAPAANDHGEPGAGEPVREATALRSRATEDGNGQRVE